VPAREREREKERVRGKDLSTLDIKVSQSLKNSRGSVYQILVELVQDCVVQMHVISDFWPSGAGTLGLRSQPKAQTPTRTPEVTEKGFVVRHNFVLGGFSERKVRLLKTISICDIRYSLPGGFTCFSFKAQPQLLHTIYPSTGGKPAYHPFRRRTRHSTRTLRHPTRSISRRVHLKDFLYKLHLFTLRVRNGSNEKPYLRNIFLATGLNCLPTPPFITGDKLVDPPTGGGIAGGSGRVPKPLPGLRSRAGRRARCCNPPTPPPSIKIP